MLIRLSTMEDLPEMMRLIDCAREFMIREENTLQWPPGYPSEKQIGIDIYNRQNEASGTKGTKRTKLKLLRKNEAYA